MSVYIFSRSIVNVPCSGHSTVSTVEICIVAQQLFNIRSAALFSRSAVLFSRSATLFSHFAALISHSPALFTGCLPNCCNEIPQVFHEFSICQFLKF